MSFISPQPIISQVDANGECCPNTFIGFCLEDGTPIGIVLQGGAQLGWTNLLTGVFTAGPPPAGVVICDTGGGGNLDCLTDSVTICSGFEYAEDSAHVSGDVGAFVLAVRNDAATPLAADGEYIPFTTDSLGALRVNADVDFAFVHAEVSAHNLGDIGAFVLAVRNDAGTPLAADGEYIPFTTDNTGALRVAASVAINSEYPEDSPHVSGDIGSFSLGVRNDAGAALTTLDGDYSPFATDSAGRIGITDLGGSITVDGTVTANQGTSPWVIGDGGGSITVDGAVTVSGTVTADTNFDFAEDTPHGSGDIGAFVLAVRNDAGTPLAADGDYIPFTTDSSGALRVAASVAINYAYAEDSPHTTGDIGAFTLAVRNDAGTPLAADGDYIPFTTDATGALRVTGSAPTINFEYAEDSPHTTGDIGAFVLAVRNDAGTPLAADGDYIPFTTDSSGALRVTGSATVTGAYTPSDAQANPTNLVGTEDFNMVWGPGINSGLPAWSRWGVYGIDDDVTEPRVPGVAIFGRPELNLGETPQQAGVVTPLANNHDSFHALRVVSSDLYRAGSLPIDYRQSDGEVDANAVNTLGIVAPTVFNGATFDRLRGGGDDTDNQAAETLGLAKVIGRTYIWDGSAWDRWTGAVSGTVTANQGTSPWVIGDGGGSITVDGTITTSYQFAEDTAHSTGAIGAFTLGVRNDAGAALTDTNGDYSPFATDSAGRIGIADLGGSITVDGTVTTSYQFAEDTAHSTGAIGAFTLAVRNDAGTPLADTTGDYIPFTTDANGDLYVTTGRNGTLANGAETSVTNVAAQILAANTARKKYIIQNTGANNIRVGVTGVTATTGFRLVPGGSMIMEMPNCPTNAIFAIREGAQNSTAFAQEIT